MPNNEHMNDNQGQGGTSGRFASGDNKPGGRHVEEDGSAGADHLKGTNEADTMDGMGGDDVIVGRGGDDMMNGGEGNDTFAHSGVGEGGDGFDTIGDYEAATLAEEDGWQIVDKVEIEASSFDFSAIEVDPISEADLLAYVQVVEGVIQTDLDGAGEASEFESIVDTGLGEEDDGVAIEIGGSEYVWSEDSWTMIA